MFLKAYLFVTAAALPVVLHAGENPQTVLTLRPGTSASTFAWNDTDDSLTGTLSPLPLRAGVPFSLSATVRPLAGPEFDGPVTFSIRPLERIGAAQSVTVKPNPGEKSWAAKLTPPEAGRYRLEIAWASTHHKVVRGEFDVREPMLPPWVPLAVGTTLVALVVGFPAWPLFSRKEPLS